MTRLFHPGEALKSMKIYDIFRFDNFEFVDGEQGHTKIKALLKLKNTSIERIFNAPIKPFDQTWIECISEDLYCSPAKLWIVRKYPRYTM